ncbi:MAG: phospholipase D family protein [Thalassobaculum sp.]|uniref:phospholipase D-like domain-containing protein n=1 Tax=Thalassobaculum sp. TaxID=2022740 RepID=UPI0032EBE2BE
MTGREIRLQRLCRRHLPDGGGSGFTLLSTGPAAFLTLHGLTVAAERTLDVQYYLWEDDGSGRRLLTALLDAADRGVRVRLLLDDIGAPSSDPELARLDAYPNVEIRLYNPFPHRFGLVFALLFQSRRVTRRMHNKAFVADRVAAVVGGRNVGDRYFEFDPRRNFRDLDLFAAGPVVEQVAQSFDAFWDSSWSRPVGAIDRGRWRLADVRSTVRRGLRRRILRAGAGPYPGNVGLQWRSYRSLVRDRFARLVVAERATVLVDAPDKPETGEPRLLESLLARIEQGPVSELLLESAYFVPARHGVSLLSHLARSGVRVRVMTNSAASGEVAVAHAAYRKYRRPLLRAGVELYELRADSAVDWGLNLHTKAAVIDRRRVFVGSLNMDPRSAVLNTEIGLLVDSEELAAQVAAFIEDGMSPARSYRAVLDDGRLAWLVGEDPQPTRREPGASRWWLLLVRLLALLPIERQV